MFSLIKKSPYLSILIILELLFFIISITLFFRPTFNVTLNYDDFSTDSGIYLENFFETGNNGIYLDNSLTGDNTEASIISVPIDIPLGSYSITICYSNNDGQNTYSTCSKYNTYNILTNNQNKGLDIGDNITSEIDLYSYLPIDDYSITFNYGGNGYLFISSITISETHDFKYVLLFSIVALSLLLDIMCLKFSKWDNSEKIVCISIIAITLFTSSPMFTYFIGDGHDLVSHIDRFVAITHSLKDQFPVRVSTFWNNGYGYAFSIFYNDIFLYIPALLRIIGFSIQDSYKIYVILTNLITSIVAYYSFYNIFKSKKMGILSMVLYCLAPYRLVCLYLRCALGEYTAQIFYPLILFGIYNIFKTDKSFEKNSISIIKKEFLTILPLIIGLNGIVSCHVLSCIMAAFFIFITCIILWRKTFQAFYFIRLFSSALITLILNLWYIIPLLDYYRDEYEVSTRNTLGRFGANGAFLWQLFSIFPSGTGKSFSIAESMGYTDEAFNSVGLYFIIGILLLIALIIINKPAFKEDLLTKICLFFSILTLFMSTYNFPWDLIQQSGNIMSALTQNIQFPWRFIGPFSLFSTIICVQSIKYIDKLHHNYKMSVVTLFITLSLISSCYFLNDSCKNQEWRLLLAESDLTTDAIGTGEYLPVGTDTTIFKDNTLAFSGENISFSDISRNIDSISVSTINSSSEDSYIDVALLYYRYYQATDDITGQELSVACSPENRIRVIIPADYNSSFTVSFKEPIFWRISELISLLSLVALICFYAYIRAIKDRYMKK